MKRLVLVAPLLGIAALSVPAHAGAVTGVCDATTAVTDTVTVVITDDTLPTVDDGIAC